MELEPAPCLSVGHLDNGIYWDHVVQAGETTCMHDPFAFDIDPARLVRQQPVESAVTGAVPDALSRITAKGRKPWTLPVVAQGFCTPGWGGDVSRQDKAPNGTDDRSGLCPLLPSGSSGSERPLQYALRRLLRADLPDVCRSCTSTGTNRGASTRTSTHTSTRTSRRTPGSLACGMPLRLGLRMELRLALR